MKYNVYRNLNNGFLSVQDPKSGLIIGHCSKIVLKDVVFKVNRSGVERIRKEKRKSVVAKVQGEVIDILDFVGFKGRGMEVFQGEDLDKLTDRAYYDPYKWYGFVNENNSEIESCDHIVISKKGKMFTNNGVEA